MGRTAKVFRRGREAFTVREVKAMIGAKDDENVRQRLKRWERGEITTERLLKPVVERRRNPDALYEELMLARIPGPTEYERRVLGV